MIFPYSYPTYGCVCFKVLVKNVWPVSWVGLPPLVVIDVMRVGIVSRYANLRGKLPTVNAFIDNHLHDYLFFDELFKRSSETVKERIVVEVVVVAVVVVGVGVWGSR